PRRKAGRAGRPARPPPGGRAPTPRRSVLLRLPGTAWDWSSTGSGAGSGKSARPAVRRAGTTGRASPVPAPLRLPQRHCRSPRILLFVKLQQATRTEATEVLPNILRNSIHGGGKAGGQGARDLLHRPPAAAQLQDRRPGRVENQDALGIEQDGLA